MLVLAASRLGGSCIQSTWRIFWTVLRAERQDVLTENRAVSYVLRSRPRESGCGTI